MSKNWNFIKDSRAEVLVSVIVISYNDQIGLDRTLKSLCLIDDSQIEILIVSGDSHNEITCDLSKFARIGIINNQRSGIYHAMNIGLERAKGKFIWFLNGGDENLLSELHLLRGVEFKSDKVTILSSYKLRIGKKELLRNPRNAKYIFHALPTSHQAIFFPSKIARNIRFNEELRIAGDYEMFIRVMECGGEILTYNWPVARFYSGGKSHSSLRILLSEIWWVQKSVLKSSVYVRIISLGLHVLSFSRLAIRTKLYNK